VIEGRKKGGGEGREKKNRKGGKRGTPGRDKQARVLQIRSARASDFSTNDFTVLKRGGREG